MTDGVRLIAGATGQACQRRNSEPAATSDPRGWRAGIRGGDLAVERNRDAVPEWLYFILSEAEMQLFFGGQVLMIGVFAYALVNVIWDNHKMRKK